MAAGRLINKVCYQLEGVTLRLPFYKCAVQLFQSDFDNSLWYVDNIGYSYHDGTLLLSRKPKGLKLHHAVRCPLANYVAGDQNEISNKDADIGIGAAALLRSSDRYILLSRRSKKLKTFPGIWVPPGGHVERGETLEEAAMRELGEEVGIVMNPCEYNTKALCLFESCFPQFIEWGQPKYHHIVVYFLVESALCMDELNSQLDLIEGEVDACVWLPDQAVKALSEDNFDHLPPMKYMQVDDGGSISILRFNPDILAAKLTGYNNSDIERLSTGTLTAIKSFVEQYKM